MSSLTGFDDIADQPDSIRGAQPFQISPTLRPGMTMADIEKEAIRQTLVRTDGSRTQASRLLGISSRTLFRKLKEYGLA